MNVEKRRWGSAVILLGAALAGCGKSDQSVASGPRTPANGAGTIHGVVYFDAAGPTTRVVSDPNYWATVYDESVVVNPNGTLKNVMVYVKDAPPGDGGGPVVVLDQVGAHYVPHVLGLQVGQPLVIRNSDTHIHNVHLNCNVNAQQNFGMMSVGDHEPITFKAPEFFEIKCDVHPWMDCQVGVFDHPYFAVTGEDGSFEIRNWPAGNYTLVARHERYGEISESVVATDHQTTNVYFTFQQP